MIKNLTNLILSIALASAWFAGQLWMIVGVAQATEHLPAPWQVVAGIVWGLYGIVTGMFICLFLSEEVGL